MIKGVIEEVRYSALLSRSPPFPSGKPSTSQEIRRRYQTRRYDSPSKTGTLSTSKDG